MKRITKRRFNALLYTFCSKGNVSEAKAATLSTEDKKFMCRVLANNRAAILTSLIPDDPEFISWLNGMGYAYDYTNKQGLHFCGTSAHFAKFAIQNTTSKNKNVSTL
jgi:hypothetical protein